MESVRIRALFEEEAGPTAGELVRRALEGDPWAEEALYRRHAPKLLAVLTRLVGHKADALDLMQDTFIGCFERLGTLRDPEAFGGWLLRSGVHAALKVLRKRRLLRRLGLAEANEEAMALVPSREASPEVRADLRRLDQVLAALSAVDRVAWILRYVEGYELSEVASATDTSLATAKRRIARAQGAVRGVIEVEEPGGPA